MGSAGQFLDILMQLQSDFRLDWSHPKIDWGRHSEWLSHMVDSWCSAGALQSSCMWPVQVIGLLTARQLSSDRRVPQEDFTGNRKLVPQGRKGYCCKWQSTISARPFWPRQSEDGGNRSSAPQYKQAHLEEERRRCEISLQPSLGELQILDARGIYQRLSCWKVSSPDDLYFILPQLPVYLKLISLNDF